MAIMGCPLNWKLAEAVNTSALVGGAANSVPAFPGAEGFGAHAMGGRGGRLIEVTNLDDSGSGSLRAAIEDSGPRIVVFQVGGTITLQSDLEITAPYLTIAGQTAPGGGITLRGNPAHAVTPLQIRTHDVVIRYIRSRPGPSTKMNDTVDALTIGNRNGGVYNVIVDHCSFSWATDEVVNSWYDAHHITVQWSIISEGLHCSTHPDGCHSKGMLLGGKGSNSISIHHNLFAHNHERSPRIKTNGLVDVVNNVIYNSKFSGGWGPSHITGFVPVNYIGNYFKLGAGSSAGDYYISASDPTAIFVRGNVTPHRSREDMDEVTGVVRPNARRWVVPTRHLAPEVTTTSAVRAYERVLAESGANASLDCDGASLLRRDAVDNRIVDEVRTGTGGIIDDPSEVGGWPEIVSGAPCPDSDHDGMPDAWERRYGFNPKHLSDGTADADGDGYTNVEEYLNGADPKSKR